MKKTKPINNIIDPLAIAFAVFNGADDPVIKHQQRFKNWQSIKHLKTQFEVIEAEEVNEKK
ncbi:MAG: hypothetical protein O2871_04065 [bacterium]|nr:hypothetical protein [bacterium]